MLKGHVFAKQIFGNPIFALFINTFLNGKNGVSNNYKNGMSLSYSGSTVTVNSGAVCIQGRFLEEDISTPISVGTDNAYCKLVIEIDLDKENTESDFTQASYKIVRSSSGYPNLTQTNIVKNNAGIYQYELARFRAETGGITNFQDMRTFLDFDSIYDAIQTEYEGILEELEQELANVEDGSAYLLKAHQLTNQDLNNYKTEGFYYGNSTNTVQNKPSNVGFFGLRVIKTADSLCTQQLVTNYNVYYRLCAGNGSWGDWKQVSLNGHTHDDRYYTETEANNRFRQKGDFTTVTGTCTLEANTQTGFEQGSYKQTVVEVNFPTGFNANNSKLISFGTKRTFKNNYCYEFGSAASNSPSNMVIGNIPRALVLNKDDAKMTLYFYNLATSAMDLDYEITLMKT